jgi:two-component system, LuxR family, sensor kinase FixL
MSVPAPSNDIEPNIMPETTLAQEQTRALFGSIPVSLATTTLLSLILSAAQWNVIGRGDLVFWNILMFCAIFLRSVTWFFWRNNAHSINTAYWLMAFRGGVWLAGATWGCSAFFMFANYNPTYQALLAFTLAGVASGSLTTLAIDKQSAMGFVALAIFPLTFRLFMEHGPIAVPMGIMSLLYIVFVLSASTRARHTMEDQHNKNTRLIAWGKERSKHQKMSKAISQAQAQFIKDANNNVIFEQLLTSLLLLTDSDFGFIGKVSYSYANKPEFRLHTVRSLTQDKPFNYFYQKHLQAKTLFTQTDNLFGASIQKGKFLISNKPSTDLRLSNMPDGHPPLSAFLGISIFNGNTQVALLGMANKENGYDENLVDFLKPATSIIAQFMEALRHNQQQKLYEEKLHDNAQHTQAILDEVFDAIITVDKSGNIQSFNHAAETIFGYRADDILHKPIQQIIPAPRAAPLASIHAQNHTPNHSSNHTVNYVSMGAYNMGTSQELVGLRRNGKAFPIEFAISELLMNNDYIYIGVVRDISERKRNDELKNQFISTVSHELRTPLTSISGALSILNSGSLGKHSEQQQKLIAIALNNSMRLQYLINDLLDMDKLLANKMELDITPLYVVELVRKAIENNQMYADKYHVSLQLIANPPTAMIYGDAHRIQQVLANLISNAAKFSPENVAVDIGIEIMSRFAKITVTDYGEGISEEFKPKIFQRFSQADSSDTRQKGGSGLGLAISKELIQRMGGSIGFTSTEGQGSCFYFELPLVNPH